MEVQLRQWWATGYPYFISLLSNTTPVQQTSSLPDPTKETPRAEKPVIFIPVQHHPSPSLITWDPGKAGRKHTPLCRTVEPGRRRRLLGWTHTGFSKRCLWFGACCPAHGWFHRRTRCASAAMLERTGKGTQSGESTSTAGSLLPALWAQEGCPWRGEGNENDPAALAKG